MFGLKLFKEQKDWQRHFVYVKDRIAQLLQANRWTDVSFSVGGDFVAVGVKPKVFHAHKLILSAASPVFATMFYGSLPEKTDQAIVISDIQSDTFDQMLTFIYLNKAKFESNESVFHLYNAAKKYMLNDLKELCIEYLTKEAQPWNALEFYKLSKFFEEKTLEKKSLKIIREQTISLLDCSELDNRDIDDMIIILEQDQLQTTEMELFWVLQALAMAKGVVKRISAQNTSTNVKDAKTAADLREKFRNAVKKIQFHTMTAEEFACGPAMSELLLAEEVRAINAYLHTPNKVNLEILYPKDFMRDVRKPKNLPHVFLDINIDEVSIGRIIIQLRSDVVPITVKKFLGNFYYGLNCFQGANFKFIDGKYGVISPRTHACNIENENFVLKSNGFGSVGIFESKYNPNESCCNGFFIDFRKRSNSQNVYIGRVVSGLNVVRLIESYKWIPSKKFVIKNSGPLQI